MTEAIRANEMKKLFVKSARMAVDKYILQASKEASGMEYWGRVGETKLSAMDCECCAKARDRVILVLESPHDKEFNVVSKCFRFRGLASGHTGVMIRRYAESVFSAVQGYGLFIINAIPFQCSLGMSLRLAKDVKREVFNTLLGNRCFQENLVDEILKLMGDGSNIIVNAMGNGNDRNMKSIIGKIGCRKGDREFGYVAISHPSRWFNFKVRKEARRKVQNQVIEKEKQK